ncbi:hypothetical protein FRB94_007996 [Tulasnella sp. JGI-2019a]|nr:hypothetical protein FRB94_007996 [Tulasnella sp. JGI-2019a]
MAGVKRDIDVGRLVRWFTDLIGSTVAGVVRSVDSAVKAEDRWNTVDKKYAVVVLLEVWDLNTGPDGAISTVAQSPEWTSRPLVEAFANWLRGGGGLDETVIKLGGVDLMSIVIDRDLVARFIQNVLTANRVVAEEFKLQGLLQTILKANQDEGLSKAQHSFTIAHTENLERCTEGSRAGVGL